MKIMKTMGNFASYYLIITYLITVSLTRPSEYIQNYRVFLWVIPFLIWLFSYSVNKINRNIYVVLWEKNTKKFNLYIAFLTMIMIITNLFSVNIVYSLVSSLFSVFLLLIIFKVVGPIVIKSEENNELKRKISVQLLTIHFIAIIGNFLFESFNWNSTIRFSGGVNPNMMALISMFTLIWFLDLKIDKKLNKLSSLGIFFALISLFWTLSRGRIIATLFLLMYLVLAKLMVVLNSKLQYGFKKSKVLKFLLFMILGVLVTPILLNFIISSDQIIQRLSTSTNSRLFAWEFLMNGFKENVIFGTYGWWNANDIIKQYSVAGMATSSHNFFLRVLSEVGILGLLAILLLPLGLILKAFYKVMFDRMIDKNQRNKLILYSGSIIAFFISQIVEDQYLQGVGDFQTGLFVWIFAATHYNVIKDKIVIKNNKM